MEIYDRSHLFFISGILKHELNVIIVIVRSNSASLDIFYTQFNCKPFIEHNNALARNKCYDN